METIVVGSLNSLCSDARQMVTVLAMVLFILALSVQAVSRLMKWKGLHVLSIVFAVLGVCFLIIYLLVPVIISWLVYPTVVEDPCAIGSGVDYVNCTPGGNCTRLLTGGGI